MTLHSEQDAIKQAVEAGYKPGPHVHIVFGFSVDEYAIGNTFSDPACWQALGKARGWKQCCSSCGDDDTRDDGSVICWCDQYVDNWHAQDGWLYHALRYFETLLSKGDMKAYWESLL